jgi:hypothetical protein
MKFRTASKKLSQYHVLKNKGCPTKGETNAQAQQFELKGKNRLIPPEKLERLAFFKTNFKGTPFSKYSYGVNKSASAQSKLEIKQRNSKMVFSHLVMVPL